MRLIDADVLKKLILEERDKIPLTVPAAVYELVKEKANLHGNAMRGGIRKALRCMEQTPTIEAEPVRHGAWIKYVIDYDDEGRREIEFKCSECGRFEGTREPYCHCGAKMDLEE